MIPRGSNNGSRRWATKDWYVYAKPPFGGPDYVLGYLGRYTHRMAISNHRITAFDGEKVRFCWRDYRHGGIQRVMLLDAVEFLRRFFLHVLPRGFVRIRRYGLLSNRSRKQMLPLARTLLAAQGREPLTASASTRLRSLALSPLRRTYARRRTLHRRSTLLHRLRFFMTRRCQSALPVCSMHAFAIVCPPDPTTLQAAVTGRLRSRIELKLCNCSTVPSTRGNDEALKGSLLNQEMAFNIHNPGITHRAR